MKSSIKSLVIISLAIVFLQCVAAGCANAQIVTNQELSTDEAVREELAKISDFNSLDRPCIKRLKESPKIIVIGSFAFDRGCRIKGAFINSRYCQETDASFSKTALDALGWEKANEQARQKLAKLWVEKILFAFSAQADRTFHAVSLDNDAIKVIVSLRLPPGVTSRNAPKLFVFDKDGNLSPSNNF